jgi:hypothetical protein
VQEVVLILAGQIAEGGLVTAHAFAVEIAEAVEEGPLILVSVGCQDQIDVAVDEGFFGARGRGGGDDQVAEDDQGLVLVIVEEEGFPIGGGEVFGGVYARLCGG